VIEKGERNYSARSGLPGCVSVGDALEDVKAEIREAIELHLEGMWQDGCRSQSRRAARNMLRSTKEPVSALLLGETIT
jgi:predicted RNase H-like HicB family nuclease